MNEREIAIISEYMGQHRDVLVHSEDAHLGFLIAVWRLSSALKAIDNTFDSNTFFKTVSYNAYYKGRDE